MDAVTSRQLLVPEICANCTLKVWPRETVELVQAVLYPYGRVIMLGFVVEPHATVLTLVLSQPEGDPLTPLTHGGAANKALMLMYGGGSSIWL